MAHQGLQAHEVNRFLFLFEKEKIMEAFPAFL